MAEHLQPSPREPYGSWRIFVKKIQSLSFVATLAVAVGMISWGSALKAQSTPSTAPDQQTPQTQPTPSPEMPPASQQTPSAQSPSSSTPSSTPDQSSQSPSTSQPPSSTPQTPSSQTPSAQPPASSTPDATAPDSGAKSANPSGSAAAPTTNPDGSQTFTGTVVKQGDKYVLKDDAGKTYDIDHQTDVAKFEGKRVRVQGTLDPSGKIMVK